MQTALAICRDDGRDPVKEQLRQVAQGDAEAASTAAVEQFSQDYKQVTGAYVRVRGAQRRCNLVDVEGMTRTLIHWVGPALSDLEGVKRLTLAPVESGWVLVDATTGWAVRDPTLGHYSDREMLLMQRAFDAGRADRTLKSHPDDTRNAPAEPLAKPGPGGTP